MLGGRKGVRNVHFSSAEHGYSVTIATKTTLNPIVTPESAGCWAERGDCWAGTGRLPGGHRWAGDRWAGDRWAGARLRARLRRFWQYVVWMWHCCHCWVPGRAGNAGRMRISALVRRVAGTVREMNDVVRRMTELRMNRDLGYSNGPPSTYAEFMLRTSTTTVHEPSARRRAAASRRASGRTGAGRMQPPARGCPCE